MRTLVAAAFAACTAATVGQAGAGQLLDIAVVDRATGQRIPVYRHGGKLYIAGRPGDRYAIAIANRSPGRVLIVTSVDGVNVVTGETASPDQDGYVLAPYQSFEIAGWRKNLNEVAAFYFTRLPDSYAARTDRPDHVGVIGLAVFREWTPPRAAIAPQSMPRSSARVEGGAREAQARGADADASAPSSPAAQAPTTGERDASSRQEKIGTGHGERERSEVAYTNFRRATNYPSETITIYYDTHARLVARGIIPGPTPVVDPNPFPGGRFVLDPKS